ncbi:MAG: YceI family protein [Wenyingzhuangia sp.]|jgi:hypothetical protein|uniref:YceI family protein n=1 Tax=Wenyingzhuangia sp. TaxID=1964193 RepID=UPI00321B75A0
MKKIILILSFVTVLTACKESKKEDKQNVKTETYQLNSETAIINWTGYKYTNKTGVKGQMQTVNISNNKVGKDISEALTGVEFSVPVSSVFSNNESRDYKLKTLFFAIMDHTDLISGTFSNASNSQGTISLTLNNETHDLPYTLDVKGKTAYLKASVDLNIWHAQPALASLHTACELLHTGTDGISKTWNTVDLDIVLNF